MIDFMPKYNRRKVALLLSGVFFFLTPWMSVDAHRLPATITEVRWNDASSSLEIIHQLHVHDAELGLARLLQQPDISLQDLEAQARLAIHVEENFSLKTHQGEVLKLEIIGAEADGDYAIVYQQVMLDQQPMALRVYSNILSDVVPGQENQVNIELFDIVQSLVFRAKDKEKLVRF